MPRRTAWRKSSRSGASAEANCFSCHRYDNEGGSSAPDLTAASGRFSVRDLVEKIINPSKSISDQYAAVVIETTRGIVVTGRIVNLHGDTLHINTDLLNPNALTPVNRKQIESMTAQARELSALAQKVATTTAEPIKDGLSSLAKKAA